MTAYDEDADNVEWFDARDYSAVVALSIVVPDRVPLQRSIPVIVDEEALRRWGYTSNQHDGRWMRLPFKAVMMWRLPVSSPSMLAVRNKLAWRVLRESLGAAWDKGERGEHAEGSETHSVAICLIPVVSATAALNGDLDGPELDIVTLALRIVAETIRALRVTTGFPAGEVTRRAVAPVIGASIGQFAPQTGSIVWSTPTSLMLDHLPYLIDTNSAPPLPPPVVDAIGAAFKQLGMFRPGAVISDHRERANAASMGGNLRSAIVDYALTCEVCLNMLLGAIYWEDEVSPAAAPKLIGGQGIVGRVKRFYAPKLKGGSWNVEQCPELMAWNRDVAMVRNRSVHGGQSPTEVEILAAKAATTQLLALLTQRLLARFRVYPKTVGLFVGTSSIERYGGTETSQMLAVHEQHAQRHEDDFAEWYGQWVGSA